MKYATFIRLLAIVAWGAIAACSRPQESKDVAEEKNREKFENKTDERDAQFVVETANSLHTLIALADVAIEKNSPRTSNAAMAVKPDFQSLLSEMEVFATSQVITLPDEATESDVKHVRALLDEKSSKFDEKWCTEIREENKHLIGEIESYGATTNDLNLKTWLNSALPQVRAVQDKLVDLENAISEL
jgi:putative membrane protein